MITATHINKKFDNIEAVKDISVNIKNGEVFGLIGTNGAGKSTFLRIACGVLKPDSGEILVDGKSVYENNEVKRELFYISDSSADAQSWASRLYAKESMALTASSGGRRLRP